MVQRVSQLARIDHGSSCSPRVRGDNQTVSASFDPSPRTRPHAHEPGHHGRSVTLATATRAAADAPIIEPAPGEDFVIPAGEVGEFGISVHFLKNGERTITFLDEEGNFQWQLIVGALSYELTNLSTGESFVFNIPGPGLVTPNPDGSITLVARGPWVLFDPFGTHIFNAGRVLLTDTVDPNTGILHIETLSIVGHNFDLCEALAAA